MQLDPQAGKAAFRLSLFVLVLAGGLLFFEPRDSAQYAVTVFSLLIAIVFVLFVVLFVKLSSR